MMACVSKDLIRLLGIKKPILQAPMAGIDTLELAIAVSEAGGLGAIACALLSTEEIYNINSIIKNRTDAPVNFNFFCHKQDEKSEEQQHKWKKRLYPFYAEFGVDPDSVEPSPTRKPFDENFCKVVEAIKPAIVSFHFGLPAQNLLKRIQKTGAIILSSATTTEEAMWLEKNGCDVVIAQGLEAGGHRGMFLTNDISTQMTTECLVSQISRSVSLPVIAAGGIADHNDVQKFLSLGAAAVQLGTAYLFCPEIKIPPIYKQALQSDRETVLTNVFSGKPARGIVNRFIEEVGPLSPDAPDFPYAGRLVNPLRQASEQEGRLDFMQLWAGDVRKPHALYGRDFTERLWPTKSL